MDIPKHMLNEDISYCLRTPTFVFEACYQHDTLRLSLTDQETSIINQKVFTEESLKLSNLGKGIDDPLDLFLIFLPAEEAISLFGDGKGSQEKLKKETIGQTVLQYNQKINNGKSWFSIRQHGVIEGGISFVKESNVKRQFSTTFSLTLDDKCYQNEKQKIPLNQGIHPIQAVQAAFEQKMQTIKKELQTQFQKRLSEEIVALQKKLQGGQQKMTYTEARRKYINDLCD